MKPLDYSVYLVTDAPERYRRGLLDEVAAALAGGVTVVQYRATTGGRDERLATARALRDLTRERAVPLLINNDVDLALAVGADGAHVGQRDLAPAEARRRLGPGRVLGLSVTSLAEFAAVDFSLVEYLGAGPVFATGSKDDAAPPTGLEALAEIVARSPKPVVAIGGITLERAPAVFATGVAGVAVIAALSQAESPAQAARALRAAQRR